MRKIPCTIIRNRHLYLLRIYGLSALGAVGHSHLIAVLDGAGAGGDDIVPIAEVGDDGRVIVIGGKHLDADALCDIAVAEGRALLADGKDKRAVIVGADGGVRHDGVVIRALLADGEGKLGAGGDVALKVKGEELIGLRVLWVGADIGKGRGDGIAPIVVADGGGIAGAQSLRLIVRDGKAHGVTHVGDLDGTHERILGDGIK